METCYRHPGRTTGIICRRCRRPICGECSVDAAVGFQCPECVRAGRRETRADEGPYGGLRSANPAQTSIALIVANAVVWLLINVTGGQYSIWSDRLALIPLGTCLPAGDPNSYFPGLDAAACAAKGSTVWVPGVADGAVWQIVTTAFTHVEIMHLAMNMLALWFLGPSLERALGRARFLLLYGVSGLAGSAFVYLLGPANTGTVGASGAVFGLIGALLVLALKVKGDIRMVLVWLGINVVYTFTGGNISWQGHLGGFLGGAAVAAILAYAPRERRNQVQLFGVGLVVAVLLAIFVFRTLALR